MNLDEKRSLENDDVTCKKCDSPNAYREKLATGEPVINCKDCYALC